MGFLKSLFGRDKNDKDRKEKPTTRTALDVNQTPPPKKKDQPKKTIQWRDSRAHLLLLSNYKKPLSSDKFSKYDDWQEVLGEPVDYAIGKFKDYNLLRDATLTEKLSTYTIKKLKPMLREREMPVSGKKAVLIERLIEADPQGMKQKTAHLGVCVPNVRSFQVTLT